MKKKLWITSILAAMAIAATVGGGALANQQDVVTGVAENWQIGAMDSTYAYGTSFDVPEAMVEVNGETVAATATVTYPDGLTVSDDDVKLSQAGIYTVTYRAVVGDTHYVEEKNFTVENKAYFVQNEESSVEYGTYTNFGANANGILVHMKQGDVLTFSQLIDFNKLTSADKLIELFVTPEARGIYDFSRIIITLTDPTDSSAQMQIQVRRWPSEVNGLHITYTDVTVYNQSTVGCERGKYKFDIPGTPHNHTFSAVMNKDFSWSGEPVEIAPDVYKTYIMYDPASTEMKVSNAHIANLNNKALFEKPWEGFPSGKAKMTITATEYAGTTASFCITSVFGIDVTKNSFTESEPPMIDVSMAAEEMPQGQVGYEYKIPAATAFDFYSDSCAVKTSVYRDYGSSTPINVGVKNGAFKPSVAGWHTIVYEAKDALGNTAIETRNVYVEEDLGSITVNLPTNVVTEATLGYWVPVEQPTYFGDSGSVTLKITATLGEESYEITDGFLPEKQGEWTVKYTVTDYIGRTGTAEYVVNATPGDNYVVLDKLVLPQIFVSDSEYTLPVIHAIDYSSGRPDSKACSVVVTDKNGEKTYTAGDKFTPSVAENGDMVTISYQYNGKEVIAREVPAVLVKGMGAIIAKNYIYGEGFSTSYKDANDEWLSAGIEITANEDSEVCGWTFATPQLVDNFNLLFEGIAAKTNFSELVITLTDSQNENEQIKISLKVKPTGTTFTVGDESLDITNTTLAADKQYTVEYNNGKVTFGDMNISVKSTVNGEAFTGFSSNLIYVHVDMLNAKAGAGYKFLSINGANISRRNLDVFAPAFKILGDFGGSKSLNQVIEIYPAVANDAFAPITELTLTVYAPDGTIVTDNNGVSLNKVATDVSRFITLSQYGRYQIVYNITEKDWVVSNPLSLVKTVFVIDEEKPQVVFTNATQTTAKVGETITLPNFVYRDNISANENIQIMRGVYSPMGIFYLFDDTQNSIECMYEGEYKFLVMVLDEHGNMASITHSIMVTK